MNDWRKRISVDPNVCHAKARIKGIGVMLSVILDNLAAGESIEDQTRGYHLERENLQAAIRYAAELARERMIPLAPGAA